VTGTEDKCPFCNTELESNAAAGRRVEKITKRVEANDPASICMLAHYYLHGVGGFQQDHAMSKELYARAADLGYSKAHSYLGDVYYERGDMKKAKFHWEAAAMAGHEGARHNLGTMEYKSGNMDRAVKHWMIAASAGHWHAMNSLQIEFKQGLVSRDAIDSTLTAYNNSCVEMRSEARDAWILHSLNL
jgi:TPR repeat protein